MMNPVDSDRLLSTDLARFCEQVAQMTSDHTYADDDHNHHYVFDSNLVAFAMRRNAEATQATFFEHEDIAIRQTRANRIAFSVTKGPAEEGPQRVFMFERHIGELQRMVFDLLNPVEIDEAEIDEFLNSKSVLTQLMALPDAGEAVRQKFRFVSALAADDVAAIKIYREVNNSVFRLTASTKPSKSDMKIINGLRVALQFFANRAPHSAHSDAIALYELSKLNSNPEYRRTKLRGFSEKSHFVFYTMDRAVIWLAGMLRTLGTQEVYSGLQVRDARLLPMTPGFVPQNLKAKSRKMCFSTEDDLLHAFDFKPSPVSPPEADFKIFETRETNRNRILARVCHLGYGTPFFPQVYLLLKDERGNSARKIVESMGIDWQNWKQCVSDDAPALFDKADEENTHASQSERLDTLKIAARNFVNTSSELMATLDKSLPFPGKTDKELFDELLLISTRDEIENKLDRAFDEIVDDAQGLRFAGDDFLSIKQRETLLKIAKSRLSTTTGLPAKLSFALLGETPSGREYFSNLSALDDPHTKLRYGDMLDMKFLSQGERYLVLAFVMAKTGKMTAALGYCHDAIKRSRFSGSHLEVEARLFEASIMRRNSVGAVDVLRTNKKLQTLLTSSSTSSISQLDELRVAVEHVSLALRWHALRRHGHISRHSSYREADSEIDDPFMIEARLRSLIAQSHKIETREEPQEREVLLRYQNQLRLQYINACLFIDLDDSDHIRPATRNLTLSAQIKACETVYAENAGWKSHTSEILLLLGKCVADWGNQARDTWLTELAKHVNSLEAESASFVDCELNRFKTLLLRIEAVRLEAPYG